mmetsp:Transcript_7209/g.20914  ORF Transcript_7209/g.20914 Transcript_7209/m.20914 type:complete len:319 (+) Transcript_7209:3163-4119(+)
MNRILRIQVHAAATEFPTGLLLLLLFSGGPLLAARGIVFVFVIFIFLLLLLLVGAGSRRRVDRFVGTNRISAISLSGNHRRRIRVFANANANAIVLQRTQTTLAGVVQRQVVETEQAIGNVVGLLQLLQLLLWFDEHQSGRLRLVHPAVGGSKASHERGFLLRFLHGLLLFRQYHSHCQAQVSLLGGTVPEARSHHFPGFALEFAPVGHQRCVVGVRIQVIEPRVPGVGIDSKRGRKMRIRVHLGGRNRQKGRRRGLLPVELAQPEALFGNHRADGLEDNGPHVLHRQGNSAAGTLDGVVGVAGRVGPDVPEDAGQAK